MAKSPTFNLKNLKKMGLGSDIPPAVRGAMAGDAAGTAKFWTPERLRAFRAEEIYRANKALRPIKGKAK